MKKVIIASLVIIAIWLLIIKNPQISNKFKEMLTSLVIVSPIPPFP